VKHKHAELMKLYAEDAMETAKPWERWEVMESGFHWGPMCTHPLWDQGTKYRRKPSRFEVDQEAFIEWAAIKPGLYFSGDEQPRPLPVDVWHAALAWERGRRNDGKRD